MQPLAAETARGLSQVTPPGKHRTVLHSAQVHWVDARLAETTGGHSCAGAADPLLSSLSR
jgi:hypothetical protein